MGRIEGIFFLIKNLIDVLLWYVSLLHAYYVACVEIIV